MRIKLGLEELGKTSPGSAPYSHWGPAYPRGLMFANVRASSRQSLGIVVGAGCVIESYAPWYF